jgi:CRP/FNR family cyclic AMP-dependent transcriptional regulator
MPKPTSPDNSDQALLKTLPPLVRALAAKGYLKHYRARTTLIEESDHGDTIFVVVSGTLRIYCADTRGREITLALYGPGEYVGEMSLDGGPRSASVITETASVCAVIGGQALRQHLAENPEFALELIRRLIRRTRLATESARSMALLDAYGRMTRLFDGLAVTTDAGTRRVKQRLTHLDISQRIGCTRELVSRILKDLETGGYISTKEHQYELLRRFPSKW